MNNYDFTQIYKTKTLVYEVNIHTGIVRRLRLRTVCPTYMVGVVDKSDVSFIGLDKKDLVFTSLIDARGYVEKLGKNFEIEIIRDVPEEKVGEDTE